ncbi:hypothetical protein RB195_009304 [Necator americanus]|uniref:Uncharacterized protein n=1 Tax=Necator americanus TaxID=51031 RepID=A0ABR1CSR2_NECAM
MYQKVESNRSNRDYKKDQDFQTSWMESTISVTEKDEQANTRRKWTRKADVQRMRQESTTGRAEAARGLGQLHWMRSQLLNVNILSNPWV